MLYFNPASSIKCTFCNSCIMHRREPRATHMRTLQWDHTLDCFRVLVGCHCHANPRQLGWPWRILTWCPQVRSKHFNKMASPGKQSYSIKFVYTGILDSYPKPIYSSFLFMRQSCLLIICVDRRTVHLFRYSLFRQLRACTPKYQTYLRGNQHLFVCHATTSDFLHSMCSWSHAHLVCILMMPLCGLP